MYHIYGFTGLMKLESLNIKWCNCITDSDMKPLSGKLIFLSILGKEMCYKFKKAGSINIKLVWYTLNHVKCAFCLLIDLPENSDGWACDNKFHF